MVIVTTTPEVVNKAKEQIFDSVFKNEPQRKHAMNYLTGLLIGSNKTVEGISESIFGASDQSSLNRFMTTTDWDVQEFNQARIEYMQQSAKR